MAFEYVLGDSLINGIFVFIIMVFLMIMTGKKVQEISNETTQYYFRITVASVVILQLFTHYIGGDFRYCVRMFK